MSELIYKGKVLTSTPNEAVSIAYNPAGSGLSATNMQDAITEINQKVVDVPTDLSYNEETQILQLKNADGALGDGVEIKTTADASVVTYKETTVADALDEITENLNDNGQTFKFGYDNVNDKYGYYKNDEFTAFGEGGDAGAGAIILGTYTLKAGNTTYEINNANFKEDSVIFIGFNKDSIDTVVESGGGDAKHCTQENGKLTLTFEKNLTGDVLIDDITIIPNGMAVQGDPIYVMRNIIIGAGETSVTVTNNKITPTSLIIVFFADKEKGAAAKPNTTVTNGQLTITIAEAQAEDLVIDGITVI